VDPARIMRNMRTVLQSILAETDDDSMEVRAIKEVARNQKRSHRHTLRSEVFANIHHISRHGSRLAPLSNLPGKLPGARTAAHLFLGVHKDRPMLAFAPRSFPEWFKEHEPLGDGHRGPAILFHDTFMDYDEPEIGIAATELLELIGFQVELSDSVCCGRPMISKGYMDRAAGQARINVDRLSRQGHEDTPIVGCEPSCLLTLRNEYPLMLADGELAEKARDVARRCFLIDELLAPLQVRDELEITLNAASENGKPRVLFHGHCQQKAEADAGLSLALLQGAGYDAELVPAPCCGMAGAFGFEKEHYEDSKRAFQRVLGPALKAAPDARVAVMGISCRKQIQQLAGRSASHVVELLREAVRMS
jgi:Fe-S oxidoreductase